MSAKQPVTAIFDIGKTNKKFLLFDDDLNVVHSTSHVFDEITDDDGYPCDDLESITSWLLGEVEKILLSKEFDVKSVNFSAYGATLVHLDEDGKPATPLYNYLKPFPEKVAEEFYQKYGGKEEFSTVTATPPMGMLNSGLQIYWLKKMKPELFSKIKTTLHFPQYLSYLLTGKTVSEKTSIGCHTGMWNFREGNYHRWLADEEILKLLPKIEPVTNSFGAEIGDFRIWTGIGIHDSSAALVPYLRALDDSFLLLSTGTWSVAMNPFANEPLTFEELKRDCLNYMNIYGKPVKASRFLLGGEYSHQMKTIADYFGKSTQDPACDLDTAILQKLVDERTEEKKLILKKGNQSGPYPSVDERTWDLGQFSTYNEAIHQCMLDLVSIQVASMNLAIGNNSIDQIILTGGFAKNAFFCRLLATLVPEKKVYTAKLQEASAIGAALLSDSQLSEKLQFKEQLGLSLQKPIKPLQIKGYKWKSDGGLHKH